MFLDFSELIHRLLDGICGRIPVVYAAFADVWSLEEWLQMTDSFKTVCSTFFARGWSSEELLEHLSLLPDDHRKIVVDIVILRQDDLRQTLVDKVNTLSLASLANFDWKAKLALSSDRMANICQPLLSVELDLETLGEKKSIQVELDQDELKKMITALESAEHAVSQLV